jgi:hypothetical protein
MDDSIKTNIVAKKYQLLSSSQYLENLLGSAIVYWQFGNSIPTELTGEYTLP